MRIFFFAFLLVFLCKLPAAEASERISRLPPEFRQTWAVPNCHNARKAFVVTKRFVFEGARYGNLLYRQKNMRRHGAIYRLQSGDARIDDTGINYAPIYDMKLVSGQLMRYEVPLFVSNVRFDPFASDYADSYVLCPAPRSKHDNLSLEGLDAVRSLDRVDEVCGTVPITRSTACQQAVFEAFDRDKDGGLSAEELARAYRQISFISPSQGCKIEIYYPANTSVESPLFAAAILKAADSDRDGRVTLEELQAGWDSIGDIDTYIKLVPLIDNLSTLLPFLPASPVPPGEALEGGGCSCLAGEKT